jgi:hypothetical protein
MIRRLIGLMPTSQMLPVALVAVLLAVPVAAEPQARASPAADTASGHEEWKFYSIYRIEGAYNPTRDQAQKLDLVIQPKITGRLPGGEELVGIARLRGDAYDRLEPGIPTQQSRAPISRRWTPNSHVDGELRELFVKFNVGDSLVTLGKQQVVWGNADGLRILDVVDPFSFREFVLEDFENARIPRWTANVQVPVGAANLQLLWLPDPTFNEIPDPGSVYQITSPRLVPASASANVNVQRSEERPNNYLSDSDFGVRLSGNWNGWDLTANYLYHYDPNPVISRTLLATPGVPTVLVKQEFRRSQLIGGTFSNAIGSFVIRGEGGINRNRYFVRDQIGDSQGLVKANELDYVIGLDWSRINYTLISGQLFQSRVLGGTEGLVRNKVDTFASLLVRREFAQQTWTAEILWLHNLKDHDGLVRPRLRHNLGDNLNVWLGADIFYGTAIGTFGQFRKEDRIVLGLEWRR